MTMRWVTACLLVACGSSPERAAAPVPASSTVTREVALRDGTIRVVVEADGNPAWASYIADRAAAYLPALEQYVGVPLAEAAAGMFHDQPQPWTVRIHGQPTVMLGAVHIGGYNNISGAFGPDRAIFVEFARAKIGDPALVLHELTHFYFHGPRAALAAGAPNDETAWLDEGIASMVPIDIGAAADEDRAMRTHWGQWGVPPAANDVPLEHDPRREGRIPIFYGKSYRVQLIIEHELGRERYRALLQDIARHRFADNAEVVALLARHAPAIDWRALLGGWVFAGPYGRYKPADVPRL